MVGLGAMVGLRKVYVITSRRRIAIGWVVLGMASAANAVVAVPNDEEKAQANRHYDSDDNGSDVGFRCRRGDVVSREGGGAAAGLRAGGGVSAGLDREITD